MEVFYVPSSLVLDTDTTFTISAVSATGGVTFSPDCPNYNTSQTNNIFVIDQNTGQLLSFGTSNLTTTGNYRVGSGCSRANGERLATISNDPRSYAPNALSFQKFEFIYLFVFVFSVLFAFFIFSSIFGRSR